MRTIGLTALLALSLGTSAMAAGIVPEEYQGVWAAARDCKANFQNVLSDAVDREFAACRVTQVLIAGHPESPTSTMSLDCGGSQSREIWHGETAGDTDYLVVIRFEQGGEAGSPSVDLYKRCPGIPLAEIPLSEIPGNPVIAQASEEKVAPPPRGPEKASRPSPHPRAARTRKRSHQYQ